MIINDVNYVKDVNDINYANEIYDLINAMLDCFMVPSFTMFS